MFPFFTNAAFLAGLAAVSVPILIHLLLRRKSQRLRFSTIQFFIKKDEQAMRKRKLRHFLLLAMRVLLFAFLVFAFARPFLSGNPAGSPVAQRQQVMILLDTSASMQASGPSGQQWKRAKEFVGQVLARLTENDRVAVAACSARTTLISEFAPPSVVSRKLADLPPTWGTGDLSEGFRQARKLLSSGNIHYAKVLYVVSDLQLTSIPPLDQIPLPAEIELKVMDLGERLIPNLAVSDLAFGPQYPTGARALITSYSDEASAGLTAEYKVDGNRVFAREVAVAAGGTLDMPLTNIASLKPGWHTAELSIQARDGLPADDTRRAVFFVPEPIHGVVVETRQVPRIYQEESFFVAAALDPGEGSAAAGPARFAMEKSGLDALSERLKPAPGRPKIEFILLPGLKQVPSGLASSLLAYVQAGGGLMLFLGDGVSANHYNTEWRDILPARLAQAEIARDIESPWRIGIFGKNSRLFAPFNEPNSGDLFLPGFTHRLALSPGPGSVVEAEFDDGAPFIVGRLLGKGRILLVNTSIETSWTDWPKHKTFVPWLHASGYYLAARDGGPEMQAVPSFAAGSEIELETGAKGPLKLRLPDGRESDIPVGRKEQISDLALETPGVYSLQDLSGRELRRIAANLPAAESELSTLAPSDFQRKLVRTNEPQPMLAAGLFEDSPRGRELWRLFLFCALALLLVEPLLANRTNA